MPLQIMNTSHIRLSTTKIASELLNGHLGSRGALDASGQESAALVMVEFYTIEPSHQLLLVYEASSLAAGDWLRIDDLEFSVDEQLTQDEVAQCIFAISGGDLDEVTGFGETANYFVYYSEELRGRLGLSPKIKVTEVDFYHA